MRCSEQSRCYHYANYSYYTSHHLRCQDWQKLLLYLRQLQIQRHPQCHYCRLKPKVNHLSALIISLVWYIKSGEKQYYQSYSYQYRIKKYRARFTLQHLCPLVNAKGQCKQKILVCYYILNHGSCAFPLFYP